MRLPPFVARRRRRARLRSRRRARSPELKIAVAADVTSIDPHFFNLFPNNNIAEHIFDKLVQMDPDSQMIPGLATSWKTIDDRPGSSSCARASSSPTAASSPPRTSCSRSTACRTCRTARAVHRVHEGDRREVEIVDPYTIRFKYAAPYPLAPNDLSTIYIVSKKAATGATTEDFNTGKAAIGSGRYKFVSYVSGDRIELVRNDNYWGEKSPCEKVTFKIIKNEAARVAALLSGDVDAIEQPPTADLARIKADPKFTVTSKISHRVIYFNFDHLDALEPVHHRQGRQAARRRIRCSTCACAARSRRRSTARRSPTA